ncbi:hypothetical protein LCGC14_1584120 [marine sediment metagenome]|uniref:Uncharacterized protein n=1 Tax=marine sediment metagenome TaxID=412755 RepID=A0A0F9LG89_9ZZZZ
MVLLEILAVTQFKRFRNSRFGKPIVDTIIKLDPDRTLKKLQRQRMR